MRKLVEELFYEVADLSQAERARFFLDHKTDRNTRNEVEALLAFDSEDNIALDTDVSQIARQALARFERTDLRCGPFRLGQVLGRGGMGTVYFAERSDGEVSQRVAIKLLQPGVDDPRLLQLFLVERQILAGLSHPNIARLLDAGHQKDGQPFLVMEFVEGTAIDLYTAGHTVRDKVRLYLKVCAAVAYLHRNLVIHRDLKPPNILVTADGEPKLLDFGVAKMIDITADPALTGTRMLTLDYASPEQIAGGRVTTASDVYSLGAVLYKLLTGTSPHRFDGNAERTSSAYPAKIVPPSKLLAALRGDLEFILMKTLRQDPRERYATVEQLTEDLENYLESRPIRARKGDAWYRIRKLLSKHWLPMAAATLAVLALTGSMLVANHERTIARRRFNDVKQLASKLFDIDAEVRTSTGTTRTRQLIVDTSLEYLRRLSMDAKGDAELTLEIGNAYMRVARVQGVPLSPNLGQMEQAEKNLRIAEEFIRSALISQPADRTVVLRAAQITHDRMLLARYAGEGDDALTLALKSAEWLKSFDAGARDEVQASAILNTYLDVAHQHVIGGRLDDGLRLCGRGSDLARSFNRQPYLGNFLWVSAEASQSQGDLDEALRKSREALRLLDWGPTYDQGTAMNRIQALIHRATILGDVEGEIDCGRSEEAVPLLERAFGLADDFVHRDASDQSARGLLAMAGNYMAEMLRNSDPRRAIVIYDHVLQHMAEIDVFASSRSELRALTGSSYALRHLGHFAEARRRLDQACARLRQLNAYPPKKIKLGDITDESRRALAADEADRGNLRAAIKIYEELLGLVRVSDSRPETELTDAAELSCVYAALESLHARAKESGPARAVRASRRQLWLRWNSKLSGNRFVRRQMLEALKAMPT